MRRGDALWSTSVITGRASFGQILVNKEIIYDEIEINLCILVE
jgi:hypothetical protein